MDPQISIIIADLTKFSERAIIGLTLDVHANLVEDTPVDVGWARAGWVPSLGKPYEGGADLNPRPEMVTLAKGTQEAGVASIASWRLTDGPLFVTSNVPYIGALNAGHSTQAPAGYVQSAIERAVRVAQTRGGQ